MFYCNFLFYADHFFLHKSSHQIFISAHSSKLYTPFVFAIHTQYLPFSTVFSSAVPLSILSTPHVLRIPMKHEECFNNTSIIMFINCNWGVTRWQWLFYMYTNILKKKVTRKFKSGGLHEKHVVATWNLGNHLSILL